MTSSTDDRRAVSSAPRGTSNGTRASRRVRLARTMRCATVGSGTRNRPRDLAGRDPSQHPRREPHARPGGEHGRAGEKQEAQRVAADVIVEGGVETRPRRVPPSLELVTELLMLAVEHLAPTQLVDRPVLRGGHEPGARIVRDARLGPALERGDERVVRQVLGETDVAGDAREPGDELGGLDPP